VHGGLWLFIRDGNRDLSRRVNYQIQTTRWESRNLSKLKTSQKRESVWGWFGSGGHQILRRFVKLKGLNSNEETEPSSGGVKKVLRT